MLVYILLQLYFVFFSKTPDLGTIKTFVLFIYLFLKHVKHRERKNFLLQKKAIFDTKLILRRSLGSKKVESYIFLKGSLGS